MCEAFIVKNSSVLWYEKKNYGNTIEPLGKLVFIICIDGFSVLKYRKECLYTVENTWLTAELFAESKNKLRFVRFSEIFSNLKCLHFGFEVAAGCDSQQEGRALTSEIKFP